MPLFGIGVFGNPRAKNQCLKHLMQVTVKFTPFLPICQKKIRCISGEFPVNYVWVTQDQRMELVREMRVRNYRLSTVESKLGFGLVLYI